MAIKYFYIDDDPLQTIEETAKGLNVEQLNIVPFQHKKWEELISFLIENQPSYQGLLLDWGLNRKNDEGDEANFDVEALAQQLRRLIVEGKLKDFPIILCSAQHQFSKIYDKLLSSHDLFDVIYEKDFFHDRRSHVTNEMIALAEGYISIQGLKNPGNPESSLLKILDIESISNLDYRITDYLEGFIIEKKPIHEIAKFLLLKLIKPSGLLINKYLLAARLGIDIIHKPNDDDWSKLLEKISTTKYTGVFSTSNDLWWMHKLLEFWDENFEIPMGNLSGPERVESLNNKYNLNLAVALRTEKSKSDYFWSICKESNCPIAISDGILSTTPIDKAPWEEDEYYSIESALELDATKVHPLERERLKKLKEVYAKVRRRDEAK